MPEATAPTEILVTAKLRAEVLARAFAAAPRVEPQKPQKSDDKK